MHAAASYLLTTSRFCEALLLALTVTMSMAGLIDEQPAAVPQQTLDHGRTHLAGGPAVP